MSDTKVADAGSKAGTSGTAEAKIVGMKVRSGEEKLGKVEEVLFDEQGAANYAVISHGGVMGIGEKRTAIPWALVATMVQGNELIIDRSRLEEAPVLSSKDVTPEASGGAWSRDADSYWQSTSPPSRLEADEPT